MLDDINKVIPQIDEKESDEMYRNLLAKKPEKKKLSFNKGLAISFAFAIAVLLAITIPVGIFNATKPTNNLGGGTDDTFSLDNYDIQDGLDEYSILGYAAFCEFEEEYTTELAGLRVSHNKSNNNQRLYSVGDSTNSNTTKYVYPFDYVKIHSAYKFMINVDDISSENAKKVIESSCGLGRLEVVIAEFETFVLVDGVSTSDIEDELICLRGYNGYYCILNNSGSYVDSNFVYSSHKRITREGVSKDKSGPIVSIIVHHDGNSRYVYFGDTLLTPDDFVLESSFKNISDIVITSKFQLYSVLDLIKIPYANVLASIKEIDLERKILYVSTNNNLSYIFINDSTTMNVELESLNKDDKINVEYQYLFEGYNPIKVLAKSITLKEKAEQS